MSADILKFPVPMIHFSYTVYMVNGTVVRGEGEAEYTADVLEQLFEAFPHARTISLIKGKP